jgi:hypothetical protein
MAAAYEPPVSDDRGPLVIRPSWRAQGGWDLRLLLTILLILPIGVARLWQFGLGKILLAGAALLAIILCIFLFQGLYMMGSRITVTADAILVTHWFRSTKRVRRSSIARVVQLSVAGGRRAAIARQGVFAFSPNGRCVLSLYAERWNKADLDRIWHHLGITPEGSWGRTILEDDLGIEFPGAF